MGSVAPPTIPVGLFAQLRFDPVLTILGILLIVLIVAGCMVVVRVRRWRQDEAAPVDVAAQLQSYHALVESGELDQQEFERIKARLEQQAAEPPDTRIQPPPSP